MLTTLTEREVRLAVYDAESFEGFYRREYARVLRLAYSLTGRRDVAEELVQDAFLACHQSWPRVSSYDDPGAWLRRVVANRCVSVFRRRLTESRLLLRLQAEPVTEPALEPRSAEVWDAVRRLPKRQAQVVALTFVDDRSVAEVAAILGIGEESVRTHLRRGRSALRPLLKEQDRDG